MYSKLQNGLAELRVEIPYLEADTALLKLARHSDYHFLLESKQVSLFSGRFSLLGIDPAFRIKGKADHFSITALNKRGNAYLSTIKKADLSLCEDLKITSSSISGTVRGDLGPVEETQRSKKKNIAQVIRIILNTFAVKGKTFLGLYGGFSYDFIRLFEDLHDSLPENDIDDFTLLFCDTFVLFDHIKHKTEAISYRKDKSSCESAVRLVKKQLKEKPPRPPRYKIQNAKYALGKKEFEHMVKIAKKYICDGELFQVVFSNILKAQFSGSPIGLYLKYRGKNPSPYMYYFEFGDEQIVGTSPEMMVRYEDGQVHLRPIAGTARRDIDPIQDHENLLHLLTDPKERAELDMLVDLGRNDLSRICKPGITVSDYRFVEKYSRVMHTVAHLSGRLRKGYTALDALIACVNAGTLTGAPKVAAMQTIEKQEKERRGYYGGSVGYLTCGGEMDTAIVIRTAHIRDGRLRYQTGAGLVYDSVPEKEHQETMNKAQAFLETFS
ncbi:MAG: anthranilate synthase component I family protein [bacterium]|nr:anthranilate synthase component I family protein [bacterium]